jgi:hypothetical protein
MLQLYLCLGNYKNLKICQINYPLLAVLNRTIGELIIWVHSNFKQHITMGIRYTKERGVMIEKRYN